MDAVLSKDAENASTLVWLAVAAFDRARHYIANSATIWWQRDDISQTALASISEIAAGVEGFVVDALMAHTRSVCSSSPEQVARLVEAQVQRDIETSWDGRKTFSNQWLKTGFASTSWWDPWLGFVEARNAWAHGLGNLTEMQLRNRQRTEQRLTAAGLAVEHDRMTVKAHDVRRCGLLAVEVIVAVDGEVRRHG